MLALHASAPQKCTPHLLPARIHHNGPIAATRRFFAPDTDAKGTQHVHFRGRHLHGSRIPLPDTHAGAVVRVTDRLVPKRAARQATHSPSPDSDCDEEEEDVMEDVRIAECIGAFDEIVVWGHGGAVDGGRDGFVRGVGEWVGWAASMHVDDEEGEDTPNGEGAKDGKA